MKKSDLESLSKEELVELARDHEVDGRSGMNKDELVSALARSKKTIRGKNDFTTPREDQNSLGYTTRKPKDNLTFEAAPSEGETADQSSVGGTGGTTVAVTDSSGPAV